ncbi:MAG: hypothetical protein WC675_05670 [Patescibacteria group bacterium]|jgi:hypothetical protein
MSRRNKIIIIVVVAVVVLLLIIIFVWWLGQRQKSISPGETNANVGLNIPAGLPSASTGLTNQIEPTASEPNLEASLKAIASTFAERFGSYSNQGNFSNLDDLKDLMTVRMKSAIGDYKADQQASMGGTGYYGVTTKAISPQITNFEESLGRAEIIVKTQRQESFGNTTNPKVFYQDLKLNLVKTEAGWKVDVAQWQ